MDSNFKKNIFDRLKKLTVNERKEDFILFFQEKYRQENNIDIDKAIPAKIRFKINAIAENYNYVFENLQLGGGQTKVKGKRNRKSIKKEKSTKTNMNKTKKSTKSTKINTIKPNKSQTKKSAKSNTNKTIKNKRQ